MQRAGHSRAHFSFAYPALASLKMGMSGSASFQRAKMSSYGACRSASFPYTPTTESITTSFFCTSSIRRVIDKMGRQEQDGSASKEWDLAFQIWGVEWRRNEKSIFFDNCGCTCVCRFDRIIFQCSRGLRVLVHRDRR